MGLDVRGGPRKEDVVVGVDLAVVALVRIALPVAIAPLSLINV